MAVHADQHHVDNLHHVDNVSLFIPQTASVKDAAGCLVFFFLSEILCDDLVMMERSPTACVPSLLVMWFSARLTFPAC